jgi:hypothetical protein
MATQLQRAEQRRQLVARLVRVARPGRDDRHPVVALAIALPCAAALLLLFGGWEQIVAQIKAVADLIGR